MKKFLAVSVVLVMFMGLVGCGGDSGSSVTIALSPANGASVAADVTIKATFSGAIETITSWNSYFTLVEKSTTTNLCEDKVTYSELVATCADATLEVGKTYVLTVTGVKDSGGSEITEATSEFTVDALANVTLIKTTISTVTDNEGEITFTFTFKDAQTTTPTLAITALTDGYKDPTVKTACALDTTDKILTCVYEGFASCAKLADYNLILSDETEELMNINFNSMDDEFVWNGKTIADMVATNVTTKCWKRDIHENYTEYEEEVLDDELTLTGNAQEIDEDLQLSLNWEKPIDSSDFAISYAMSLFVHTADMFARGPIEIKDGGATDRSIWIGPLTAGPENAWGIMKQITLDNMSLVLPIEGSFLSDYTYETKIYTCVVVHEGTATTYASLNGIEYTQLSANNMECVAIVGMIEKCTNPTAVTSQAYAPTQSLAIIGPSSFIPVSGGSVTTKYNYIKFNTHSIAGAVEDCPVL